MYLRASRDEHDEPALVQHFVRAVSSVLFGLWHIRPTLGTLATNDLAEGAWAQVGAVTAAVTLTTVGGLLFSGLRLASGSLVAPLIVHTAANSAAIVAAYLVLHGA